jgi:hypothetical protein
MPSYSLKLNLSELDKQIQTFIGKSPKVKEAAAKQFSLFFITQKRLLLQEFDRHPVTVEIQRGPRAVNISNTLDGYGNLFSFIGFELGSKPAQELKELLENGINFRQTVYRNGGWYFRIDVPTKIEIENITQMPWEAGNSWAFGIEKGISGLSHYMFKKWENGRSHYGFELPYTNMEDAIFKTRPYISEILANFRNRINTNQE